MFHAGRHAMKIATFNINDINERLARLVWLRTAEPDVGVFRN